MRVTPETYVDNGYEQEPIGPDRVRFTVHPAVLPRSRRVPLLFGGVTGVLVVVGSGGPAAAPPGVRLMGGLFVAIAVSALVGVVARTRARLRDRLRLPGGSFVASPSGIDADGQRIAREALNALTVRNPLVGRGAPALVRASYVLCVGATILAGGMSEAVARGLLADVRRILDSGRPRYSRTTASSTGSFPSR